MIIELILILHFTIAVVRLPENKIWMGDIIALSLFVCLKKKRSMSYIDKSYSIVFLEQLHDDNASVNVIM
jgi:hypothetical protein